VDPVPDPLLLRKSGSAGDRTRDLCICSQKLWPLDHRGGQSTGCNVSQFIYFCKTLYMFQTGFPSIIRSSELHTQRQVFVTPILLPAARLVQALKLCTGFTAYRRSRGIVRLFLDHGTIRGWGVSVTLRPLFTSGEDPVPIVQEDGWAPGPVWTGAENLACTGIRSPGLQARSQSLYRLSYPAHKLVVDYVKLGLSVKHLSVFCFYSIATRWLFCVIL